MTVSGATSGRSYTITDNVTSGLSARTPVVSDSNHLDCSATSGNAISCTLGNATPVGSYTITIPITVPNTTDAYDQWDNSATFAPTASRGPAPVTSNTDSVTVVCSTVEVVKQLVPSNDSGTFNLFIEDANATVLGSASGVGNDGSTGPTNVVAGDYTLGETASGETNLADYVSSISCLDLGTNQVVTSGDGTTLDLSVVANQSARCMITNAYSDANPGRRHHRGTDSSCPREW